MKCGTTRPLTAVYSRFSIFYEAGLLNINSANALCKDLKRIISLIQEKCNKPNTNFAIYYNELILLNNNMLIESEEKLTMFVPYTLLGYLLLTMKKAVKMYISFSNSKSSIQNL
ncbi:hypothetical protein ACFFWB_26850 [Flavobacterium procerum]|uniref:hypothetical protein n=1 Tax=Flavobacterium procerum TaxID=1455569 RepID=UPI0035EDE6A7